VNGKMQTARDYFDTEVKRLTEAARTVARKAEDEGRAMSGEERESVERHISEINGLKGRIADLDANQAIMDALNKSDTEVVGETETASAKTPGDAFVGSENYKALIHRGLSGKWTTGPVVLGHKLTDGGSPAANVESITGAGGALPLQPQVAPMLGPVEQRLTIAALFGAGTATQNTIVYLEETTTTPGALDAQYTPANAESASAVLTSEGGVKPAAFIDFTKRSVSVDKIAAFLPVSDEMLEDEPQVASYINGRLPLFVQQAEERYLLDQLIAAGIGAADASGDLSGTNMFDAIAAGIMSVENEGGLSADSVVMNPVDFWKMAISKTGVSGDYFGGGPFGPSRNPWGLNVVVTNAVAAASPIVGAFREGATVWRKGGLSVEASNSHADYFRRNLTALRAEERLALAVYRPDAFQVVTV